MNTTEEQNVKFLKDDKQKPNLAIIFDTPKAVVEISDVMSYGAKKYDRKNWSKVDDKERYLSATLRHISSYANGESIDEESGLNHLAHAATSLMFLLEMENRLLDD